MRSRLSILFLLVGASACDGPESSSGPFGEGPGGPPSSTVTIVTGDPEGRLSVERRDVAVVRDVRGLTVGGSGSDLAMTLVGSLTPPTVDGVATQATSAEAFGSFAVVTYGAVGSEQKGAVDLIDLSTPSSPSLASQALFAGADVNRAVIVGTTLYVAVSGEGAFSTEETAALRSFDLSSKLLDLTGSLTVGLSSFVTTDVDADGAAGVYATTGDDGHLIALDDTLVVTASVAMADARSVTYGEKSGTSRVVAVQGSPSQVVAYDTNLAQQWTAPLGGLDLAGAPVGVEVSGGKVFVSSGSNGIKVHDLLTGEQLTQLALPSAASLGVLASELVVNDLAVSNEYLAIAAGAGGVLLARSTVDLDDGSVEGVGALGILGRLSLADFNSGNDVALGSSHIIAASGTGGTRIVLPSRATAFSDATAAVGLDATTASGSVKAASILVGDLDGDGDMDAVAGGDAPAVYIKGSDGTFASTSLGTPLTGQLALMDFDDDGDLDFTDQGGGVFLNGGTGLFTRSFAASVSGPSTTLGLATSDVNRDGYTDLFIPSDNGNWIGFNDGAPSFTASSTVAGVSDAGAFGSPFDFVASADVDGDRRADLLLRYDTGRLFLSNTSTVGTFFRDEQGISMTVTSTGPVGACFGDIDGDGDVDLFSPSAADGVAGTLFVRDGGSFSSAVAGLTDTGEQTACTTGDFDGDGHLDLFIGKTDGGALYRNDGSGSFLEASEGLTLSGHVLDARFVDMDQDGDLDLLVLRKGANHLYFENGIDVPTHLLVRPLGFGPGLSSRTPSALRVDLLDADDGSLLQRREVNAAEGGGQSPGLAFFGGVNPDRTYDVRVHFPGRLKTVAVTPRSASTNFGDTTVSQMVTISESSTAYVVTDTTVVPTDAAIASQLESLAFDVTYIEDAAVTSAMVADADLVVISHTVNSDDVDPSMFDLEIPLINMERALVDDFGFCDGGNDSRAFNRTVEPSGVVNPIVDGFASPFQVSNGPSDIRAIRNLAPGVDGLLQTTAESGRYFLAVAEQGAILEDGSTSPRRRAFYGLIELQEANADGVELFRRCVSWVLGEL